MTDKILDTRGLNCPLPVLKARKALQSIAPNGTLEILATDPGAVEDFQVFCSANGHSLLHIENSDGVFRFIVRRKQ